MKPEPKIQIEEIRKIADNDHGYVFGVGRIGDRWVGFAVGRISPREKMIFFLPGVSEGAELGLLDRERAILLTGAIAADPEHSYGGVARWFVEERLRGRPQDFRCPDCNRTGCNGDCIDYDYGEQVM